MNNSWIEYTSTQCSDDYQKDKTNWFDLSGRVIVKISGTDAEEFLHGQFSNDLKALDGSNSQVSSISTPKGRLLSIFRITRIDDYYLMSLAQEVAEKIIKRLRMFVMRSDVLFEELNDDWVVCGLSGEGAIGELQATAYVVPEAVDQCQWSQDNSLLIVRVPGEKPRFEIYAPAEQMIKLWQTAPNVSAIKAGFWKLEQIQAGLADIYPETSESFVAQMVNLHITGAVNFKKGCYPGQEIIARLQYLGKLKRKMYRYQTVASALPAVGSDVIVQSSGDISGNIVEAAFDEKGKVQLLIVLKAADVEAGGALAIKDFSSEELIAMSLPYELTD